MVEPQNNSVKEKILSLSESKNQILFEESKGLSQEEVSLAMQKIDGFKTLKTELDTDLQEVLEKKEALKNKIKDNV